MECNEFIKRNLKIDCLDSLHMCIKYNEESMKTKNRSKALAAIHFGIPFPYHG